MIDLKNRKRVLVLDDDPEITQLLFEILNEEDMDVKIVHERDVFFTEVDQHKPDLIIIDYMLPEINGGEICHQIKTGDQTSRIPVIILTAYSRVFESIGDYGCDAMISKPFDMNDLLEKVTELTG